MRLDVHIAAQEVRKQLIRAEHILPLAQATEKECKAAMVVAERALEANPVLHGGIVPDKKPIGGGFVQTAGRRRAVGDRQREELRHSLRQLAACAHKGAYSMGRRGQALTACVGVLKQTYKVLSAVAPEGRDGRPASTPRSPEHGCLSPGTMATGTSPFDLNASANGSPTSPPGTSRSGRNSPPNSARMGASGGRSSSPRPGSPRSGRHSPVADDGPDDLTRAVWMTEMSGLDIRAGAVRSCAAAGNLAKAAQNLIAYTREQVRFVRSGLLSYKIKVQEAQRLVAANPSKGKDHLANGLHWNQNKRGGSPNRSPKSPGRYSPTRGSPTRGSPTGSPRNGSPRAGNGAPAKDLQAKRWPPQYAGKKSHSSV